MKALIERFGADRMTRWAAGAVAFLMVTAVASIGQVSQQLSAGRPSAGSVAVGPHFGQGAASAAVTTAAGPTSAPAGSGPSVTGGAGFVPGANAPSGATQISDQPKVPIPDYGLQSQGVTDKEVKLGVSWDVSPCGGDQAALQAMLGAQVTGDPNKAYHAFVQYINDTGGIGGRQLHLDVANDGDSNCPEQALAAARQMADDYKDFATIPGLNVESDYLISRHLPVFGGADDPASLQRYGANGLGLIEPIDPTMRMWASFGAYYLNTARHTACLIHPSSDSSGDWELYSKLLVGHMSQYGLKFRDIIVYENDLSTAQQQSNAAIARAKADGCDEAWVMSGNPIAWIFLTQTASQNLWFPTWTFTSYTALADSDLAGSLMDQRQWANAIGLSSRVPAGQNPAEGNCARIYQRYYSNDNQSGSASVQIACAQIMSAAEIMRHAIIRTGVLTANSLLMGADSIKNNFWYDATVPMEWDFPSPSGPFKTKAFSDLTVVRWDSNQKKYVFPTYPLYWKTMGPNGSGSEDLRSLWAHYKPDY